ncbi:MAG: hypothetical protein JWQ38_1154 [Flavipsychrobacter sp.]|nr:hypothetical protein [Flavipsychrobacter sp.]
MFLFMVLLSPMLQYSFSFVKSGPLNGIFNIAPNVNFSWQKWMDGTYQDGKSKFINDNIGFRPDLIRANDQVDYSCFNKVHSEWRIIAGRNYNAFQDVYIYAHTGKDFVGYETVRIRMKKLKAVQDTLQRLGKSLVLIYAPGKADFYSEDIPKAYDSGKQNVTNMAAYAHAGDSLGVNQINFNSWFIAMKQASKELLYPKQGFHWSVYGSLLAADSFVSYTERLRNIRMPHPVLSNMVHTTEARETDDDLAKGLNLIFPTVKETFTYPEVTYPEDKTLARPKTIYIGDSFLFTWMNTGFMDNTNEQWQIWYYFRHLLNSGNHEPEKIPMPADWINELNKNDYIVLMYTSRNLGPLGDGFIEQAYDHFYPLSTANQTFFSGK